MSGAEAAEGGPCVKHRCANCDRLFDNAPNGTDCPRCGAVALCTLEDMERCR